MLAGVMIIWLMSSERPPSSGADQTVGESAYRRLRQDILFGRLAPGARLRLDALREAYGVSVSTLRENLNRLATEGFVLAEGQRGFDVAPVSADGFREVAAMRLLLECEALRQSLALGDLEWEGTVVAAHYKLQKLEARIAAGDAGATALWKRYDREFHHALVCACGSETLLETHAAVYDHYLRYQMVAVIYRGEIAGREHRLLLEHALDRRTDAAIAVLRRHVDDCVATALNEENPSWLSSAAAAPGRNAAPAPASRPRRASAANARRKPPREPSSRAARS